MAARNTQRVHPPSPDPEPASTIGMLFCRECDHRSRFDGEWVVVETESHTAYLCPNCHVEIIARERSVDDPGP